MTNLRLALPDWMGVNADGVGDGTGLPGDLIHMQREFVRNVARGVIPKERSRVGMTPLARPDKHTRRV